MANNEEQVAPIVPNGIDDIYNDDVQDIDDDLPDAKPPTAQESLRYFGVDFDVSGLVRRFKDNDIIIPTFAPPADANYEGFQRQFVWPKKQMDRFIESLLLGYPVPGIFLVEQPDRTYLVLDGQQRLRTLLAFYEGEYERNDNKLSPQESKVPFNLEYVSDELRGLEYKTLSEADRRLLDSTLIQATVVVPKDNNMEAVYIVFERINSSGIKLTPQEIRVALFSGELVRLLRDLNEYVSWRSIFGPFHIHLKDHELILRYLMLLESGEALAEHKWDREATKLGGDSDKLYQSGMSRSLNKYLEAHQSKGKLINLDKEQIIQNFKDVTDLLNQALGKKALRPKGPVNAAHTDALLVAMTVALNKGVKLTPQTVVKNVEALLENPAYLRAIMESTAHLESVMTRLCIAGKQFTGK